MTEATSSLRAAAFRVKFASQAEFATGIATGSEGTSNLKSHWQGHPQARCQWRLARPTGSGAALGPCCWDLQAVTVTLWRWGLLQGPRATQSRSLRAPLPLAPFATLQWKMAANVSHSSLHWQPASEVQVHSLGRAPMCHWHRGTASTEGPKLEESAPSSWCSVPRVAGRRTSFAKRIVTPCACP